MDGREVTTFRRRLLRWYAQAGRDLPWKGEQDPYRVWLREIMLQQTTVAAVLPYLERFLAQFPTIKALANADEAAVLRQWEGLGYYSRARNLRKAAQKIVTSYGGQLPPAASELEKLPGIGRYTAGAIASFAYDQPAAIVEANTERLYCRLLGFGDDPRTTSGRKTLWEFAARLVPKIQPGQFNQALMDLGATVCTPRQPHCESCPVKLHCQAFQQNRVAEIPQLARKAEITEVVEAAVAIRCEGKWLLRQRGAKERWAGMWDFPRFPLEHPADATVLPVNSLREGVMTQTGHDIVPLLQIAEIRHSVTRYKITLRCFVAELAVGQPPWEQADVTWVEANRFSTYPLSVTGRKLADRLKNGLL